MPKDFNLNFISPLPMNVERFFGQSNKEDGIVLEYNVTAVINL